MSLVSVYLSPGTKSTASTDRQTATNRDRPTDQQTSKQTNRQTDGRTDGRDQTLTRPDQASPDQTRPTKSNKQWTNKKTNNQTNMQRDKEAANSILWDRGACKRKYEFSRYPRNTIRYLNTKGQYVCRKVYMFRDTYILQTPAWDLDIFMSPAETYIPQYRRSYIVILDQIGHGKFQKPNRTVIMF